MEATDDKQGQPDQQRCDQRWWALAKHYCETKMTVDVPEEATALPGNKELRLVFKDGTKTPYRLVVTEK